MDRYIIIEGSIGTNEKLDTFKADVNDKLAEGYEPLGSPVIAGEWIMQTMFLSKEFISLSYRYPHPNPLA